MAGFSGIIMMGLGYFLWKLVCVIDGEDFFLFIFQMKFWNATK